MRSLMHPIYPRYRNVHRPGKAAFAARRFKFLLGLGDYRSPKSNQNKPPDNRGFLHAAMVTAQARPGR
jgi:hypothetical protein